MTLFLEKLGRDVGKRKWRDEGRGLERKVGRKDGLRDGGRGMGCENRLGRWRRGKGCQDDCRSQG